MGVDYSGHYGIGIEVKVLNFEDETLSTELKEFDSMEELLDEFLEDKPYVYFQTGENSYTGEENDFFIEVLDPFDNGWDLKTKKYELLLFLEEIGLTPIGEFGAIGGLEVS